MEGGGGKRRWCRGLLYALTNTGTWDTVTTTDCLAGIVVGVVSKRLFASSKAHLVVKVEP